MKHEPTSPSPLSESYLPPGTGWMLLATLVIGLLTVVGALYPFRFGPRSGSWLALTHGSATHVAMMVVLFVPIGIAEGSVVHRILGAPGWVILLVAVDVALLSLICETTQLWMPVHESSAVDLVANTLGGTAGGLLGQTLVGVFGDEGV